MRWVKERVSLKQQEFSYAWRTLMNNHVPVSGGSDSPIETCSPLIGMYDAIYRHSREDVNDVYRGEECLSFSEALWIYTVGGAFAAGCENMLGAIKLGYAADMVLINPDVVMNPRLLASTKPAMVISAGKPVFIGHDDDKGASTTVMKGPFIPGKNGMRMPGFNSWRCSCSILGKTCDILRQLDD
jgi:predicted amidohydrolase YtcJ